MKNLRWLTNAQERHYIIFTSNLRPLLGKTSYNFDGRTNDNLSSNLKFTFQIKSRIFCIIANTALLKRDPIRQWKGKKALVANGQLASFDDTEGPFLNLCRAMPLSQNLPP
jgi:hypothetical protein